MSPAPSADSRDLGLARGIVDSWSCGDVEWLLDHSGEDVELRPLMGTEAPFRGREGTIAFVREFRAAYQGLTLDVEGVRQAADPVALDIHVHAHLRDSNAELDGRWTFVFWIREDKLVRYEGHVDEEQIAAAMTRRPPGED